MGNMLDDEGSMVLSQLEQLERAITMIRSYVGKDYEKQLPAWVQAKITLATDYADTVGNYITSKNEKVTEEVNKPKLTALDRWRKAATEREIKHNNIEKQRQEKLHQDPSKVTIPVANTQKDNLSTAINRLEKHLNKEEVELDEGISDFDRQEKSRLAKAKISSAALTSKPHDDKLLARTGMNMAHKFPRKGQTNLSNIPGMNTPGVSKDTADYAEKRRGDRAKELKPAIKSALGTHGPKGKLPEEVEQIDELKKSTVFSWLKKQPVVPEKKPGMDKKAHNQRIKTHSKSWNRALDRLSGYKPTSENTLDSLAATEAPCDNSDMTNGTSKAAKMVKDLKKKIKEETYDWEKDDKSSMQKPYGKAPKINVTDKKGTLGDTKPEARAVMKGGTTLTGQPRDMVEIDPSMKQRPGQQDKGQSTFTSAIAKKSPNNT